MNKIRLVITLGLVATALLACTSEKPTTEDHVLKGQVQSMEKARQVEGVMQERVDSLNQRMESQPSE